MELSNEQTNVLKDAIATFGEAGQLDMVIEECLELCLEVCRKKRKRTANLPTEIADVYIMLKQLVLMVDDTDAIQVEINRKIARLNCRISESKQRVDFKFKK